MFKKILKMTTLMTSLSFAPLAKADEMLAGEQDVVDLLQALEEESNKQTQNLWDVLENVQQNGPFVDISAEDKALIPDESEEVTPDHMDAQIIPEEGFTLQGNTENSKPSAETVNPEEIEGSITLPIETEAIAVDQYPQSEEPTLTEGNLIDGSMSDDTIMPVSNMEDGNAKVWLTILAAVGLLGTAVFLGDKIEDCRNKITKRKKMLNSQSKTSSVTEIEDAKTQAPSVAPVVININVSETDGIEQRQKALRQLAQNKAKRALLTKQKRALVLELNNPDISPERKLEIEKALEDIALKRRELSQERQEACRLYKGKKGEALAEQRRLYAKKMRQLRRLMQKDGLPHLKEINEINAVREAIKQEEKRMMAEAGDELDARVQKANWLHGIRSLKEVQAKQQNFENKIAQLKKETGLKKKEVLASDYALWYEQRLIEQEKRGALRLIKGRAFTKQKSALTKQLKVALAEGDIQTANEISTEYARIKAREKKFMDEAKTFDYNAKRIYMLNTKTAQRILERRQQEQMLHEQAEKNRLLDKQKRKRLVKANFLRGQRMLYQLRHGLVPSVNENRITPQAYKKEALKLIGSKKSHYLYQPAFYQKA